MLPNGWSIGLFTVIDTLTEELKRLGYETDYSEVYFCLGLYILQYYGKVNSHYRTLLSLQIEAEFTHNYKPKKRAKILARIRDLYLEYKKTGGKVKKTLLYNNAVTTVRQKIGKPVNDNKARKLQGEFDAQYKGLKILLGKGPQS